MADSDDLSRTIRNLALANAVRYDGKANAGSVLGSVMASDESLKARIKEIGKLAAGIIKEVNAMTPEDQLAELKEHAPELLEVKPKEEKPKELPALVNAVEGAVVTRFPPEPGKPMHAGHAAVILLNEMEARKHNGKFVLRFEETDPEKDYVPEIVEMIRQDLEWLGVKVDQEIYASDHMDSYYEKAEQLIKQKDAYICFCNQEVMRDLRMKKEKCACSLADNHLENWNKMKEGAYNKGECVLRLSADMNHPNGTMRDPVIMRVVKTPHFRQKDKYKVWPLYDFESPIAEDYCGVTHIMRSDEFDQRIELQELIKKKLGLKHQEVHTFGRLNVIGAITKGREIRQKIENGELTGWDDPRLVTLQALKRRGIIPDTLRQLVFELGWERGQKNLDFTIIAAINRKLIDKDSNRMFFVENPIEIVIENSPEITAELENYPGNPEKGVRKLVFKGKAFVQEDDLKDANGLIRLMGCANIRKEDSYVFDSKEVEVYKKQGGKIIQWLPEGDPATILMPDATIKTGMVEKKPLKEGTIVMFERFGFCRYDGERSGVKEFRYTHN